MNNEISQSSKDYHYKRAAYLIEETDFSLLHANAHPDEEEAIEFAYLSLATSLWVLKQCSDEDVINHNIKLINTVERLIPVLQQPNREEH